MRSASDSDNRYPFVNGLISQYEMQNTLTVEQGGWCAVPLLPSCSDRQLRRAVCLHAARRVAGTSDVVVVLSVSQGAMDCACPSDVCGIDLPADVSSVSVLYHRRTDEGWDEGTHAVRVHHVYDYHSERRILGDYYQFLLSFRSYGTRHEMTSRTSQKNDDNDH